MFALSTAWNADRHEDGRKLIEEIFGLGVKNIELNFSLTRRMVDEIFKFARQKGIGITSLHNYCPIPEGLKRIAALPDCFSLSSVNEEERKKAVEFTKITISTAKKLKARTVVLHAGRVEMEDKTRQLIDLCNAGQKEGEKYREVFYAFVAERKAKREEYFLQIVKSLKTLIRYAERYALTLGIENRFYYREIPAIEEFSLLFDELKNRNIGLWLDVGHATIHEKLGFMEPGALLKNHSSRLLGVHFHNVRNFVDHQAPFDGDFDFDILKPFLRPDTLKVIEVHSNVSPQGAKDSLAYLEGIFHD